MEQVKKIKIAYIGGGSRGWAWGLMSDLATCPDMTGDVYLYDIDFQAAKNNEIIGNKYNEVEGAVAKWSYRAVKTIGEALTGADFVVISILPGTFDEMESDVHVPEKYGIYQSVGDTSGPGGIIRALRTLPMMEEIALAIKEYAPNAWVINYTNPMTLCVSQLYKTFPEIKAFGCCHEVFGTQKFLSLVLNSEMGIANVHHKEIKVNVVGVNHFTWLTAAHYRDIDLLPIYRAYCEKHAKEGNPVLADKNWMNSTFKSAEMVKMDLFLRTGYIAAAGDRHLAEFCPGKWYLESPERVKDMKFGLTTVAWRKNDLKERLAKSARLISGEEALQLRVTGEEGVIQMRALLGLGDLVTNVNIPNMGQIPNLPLGAVVETNAQFTRDRVSPVMSGEIPPVVNQLVSRICNEQLVILEAVEKRDLNLAFAAFAADPLVTCSLSDARKMFDEMIENTKQYLTMYF
ncbi:MAG: alpha-glucosidase/alpha-galactosidase [Ruminococcaceae bacterium]|nr:alpha-glucosidase/alpha-galactosidase [Oscillospiraceae bacterium]